MSKQRILDKFQDKVIGDKYNSTKLYVTDVSTEDDLISVLYDTLSHEIDLNEAGVNFLEEYWGLENIANLLLDNEEWDGDFHVAFKDANGIEDWLSHFRQGRQLRSITAEEKIKSDVQKVFFNKYEEKKLGGVMENPDKEYYIGTFMNEEKVLDFLIHLSKGITYLTLAGYEFMNEFYGFKYLATNLYEKYPEHVKSDPQKNLEWLVEEKHSLIR